MRYKIKKFTSIVMLFCILTVTMFGNVSAIRASSTYVAYDKVKRGVITDPEGDVNVRTTPSTGTTTNILGIQLDYYDMVTVLGEDVDIDGRKDAQGNIHKWYHIKGTKDGKEFTGYVRGDLIRVYDVVVSGDKEAIRNELTLAGFPSDYVEPLTELKASHPNWNFVPYFTNCDWGTFVGKQLEGTRNLVDNSYPSSWKSMDYGYFDWVNNRWVVQEGSTRVKASKEIIEYYLDPRNFFDEKQIFQFELLAFDSAVHNEQGVENILIDSFMSNTVLEDEEKSSTESSTESSTAEQEKDKLTYAKAFMIVGSELGMSPYYLASKVLMEQGRSGTSGLISGTYPGYEGYYNFYNIGATGLGDDEIIRKGLEYAKQEGWNTKLKSLKGGASDTIIYYIERGQNNLYLQRFDVVDYMAGSWLRQYAQYVWSAHSEAATGSKAYYSMGIQDSEFTFRIPVYKNMPTSPCAKPTKDGNPNYKLGSLSVGDYALTPSFDTDTLEYAVVVDADKDEVNISAKPYAGTTKVAGAGKVKLNTGANVIKVTATAENGDARTYTLNITKKAGSPNKLQSLAVEGYSISPAFNSDVFEYTLTVPYKTESINIGANTSMSSSEILGTGKKSLNVGENIISVIINGADGSTNTYNIKVTRTNEAVIDVSSFSVSDTGYIHGFKVEESIASALAKIKVNNGSVKILASDGSVADGIVATGQRLVLYNNADEVQKEYPVVVYGDVNGDGKLSLIDRTILKRNIWGEYDLSGVYKEAADTNHDGKVSLIDRTYLKRAVWKEYELIQ